MGFWKRWSAKRKGAAQQSDRRTTCPYCGSEAVEKPPSPMGYTIWECECSAVGSGSPMYPDLDEVADGLLAVLGLRGKVSEPSTPSGSSDTLFLQHYDIPKSLGQLDEILRGHGFELQVKTWHESGHRIHGIWARRTPGE